MHSLLHEAGEQHLPERLVHHDKPTRGHHVSSRYEIRLRGRLTRSLTSEFRRFDLTVAEIPVETMLDGDFADQSALYGILRFIEDLGLEIVEVRRVRAAVETTS
jgi:hypothetical protein